MLGGAGNRAVGAEHATVTRKGPHAFVAGRADPEELARLRGHLQCGLLPAGRAGKGGGQFNGHSFILVHRPGPETHAQRQRLAEIQAIYTGVNV